MGNTIKIGFKCCDISCQENTAGYIHTYTYTVYTHTGQRPLQDVHSWGSGICCIPLMECLHPWCKVVRFICTYFTEWAEAEKWKKNHRYMHVLYHIYSRVLYVVWCSELTELTQCSLNALMHK